MDSRQTSAFRGSPPLAGGTPPSPTVPSALDRLRGLGSFLAAPAGAASFENKAQAAASAVAPTNTTANQPTGSVGSTTSPLFSGGQKVGSLALWQMNNQPFDTVLRVAAPIAGILLFHRGHQMAGGALVAGAALLWANRLTSINL